MKNNKNIKKEIFMRLCCVAVAIGIVSVTPKVFPKIIPTVSAIAHDTAVFSAGLAMPEGGEFYIKEQIQSIYAPYHEYEEPEQDESTPQAEIIPPASEETALTSQESTPPEQSQETAPTEPDVPLDTSNMLKVKEQQIKNTGLNSGSVWVKKQTANKTIDVATELEREPDIAITKNSDQPQVLIVHTHTTESYMDTYTGYYSKDFNPRNTDKSKSVVRVADEIVAALENAGIKTVHATTYHDYPKYNGSYGRAEETIAEYLKKYPSIQVVLDVHRDGMEQDDGTKIKPTAVINGQKAAQVMIISGCDDEDKLNFPDWEKNMRFAVRLQKSMADTYPGLARPILFAPFRYNMHMTHGSLLIEFGTDSNTLDEAVYSAQLFGECLVDVLNGLTA